VRPFQVRQNPIQVWRKAFRAPHRDRLVDVLALATVAVRRNHHPARNHVGDLTTQLAAHQVQARVDARGRARAGDEVAVVDVEDVAVDLRRRVHGGQFVGVHPVRRAGAPVEEACGTRHEGTRAHGEDGRAGRCSLTDGVERLLWIVPSADGGDGDQVGVDEVVETVVGSEPGAH
jgi:hypothetical protein